MGVLDDIVSGILEPVDLRLWEMRLKPFQANVGEAPADLVQRITPEYFDALGLTLVSGRLFTHADDAESRPIVVISEAMAQKHWPGEDALGKRFRVFSGERQPSARASRRYLCRWLRTERARAWLAGGLHCRRG